MARFNTVAHDALWKRLIETLFPYYFVQFFMPSLYKKIDWTKGFSFLDGELLTIKEDWEFDDKRIVDKLVKIFLK